MRFLFFSFFLLVSSLTGTYALGASAPPFYGYFEVDLAKKKIQFNNFYLGKLKINGIFSFRLKKESSLFKESSLDVKYPQHFSGWILNLEGRNIFAGSKKLSEVKLKLVKRGEMISLSYLYTPLFTAKGKVDWGKNEILLKITGNWQENSPLWQGRTQLHSRLWGKIGELFASGTLRIDDGRYQDLEFTHLFLDFFGKVPLFNINNSQIILKDSSRHNLIGMIDIRDLENIVRDITFVSQKVYLGDWELFSLPVSKERESFGLKKRVGNNFDVLFDTYSKDYGHRESGAELRYKISDKEFLKMRIEDDRNVVGFEKRTEF